LLEVKEKKLKKVGNFGNLSILIGKRKKKMIKTRNSEFRVKADKAMWSVLPHSYQPTSALLC
jgi:hypothetical protein